MFGLHDCQLLNVECGDSARGGGRCKDGSLTSLVLKLFQMYFVSSQEANVLWIQMSQMCMM